MRKIVLRLATYRVSKINIQHASFNISCGVVARICGFHSRGPDPIPGMGRYLSFEVQNYKNCNRQQP